MRALFLSPIGLTLFAALAACSSSSSPATSNDAGQIDSGGTDGASDGARADGDDAGDAGAPVSAADICSQLNRVRHDCASLSDMSQALMASCIAYHGRFRPEARNAYGACLLQISHGSQCMSPNLDDCENRAIAAVAGIMTTASQQASTALCAACPDFGTTQMPATTAACTRDIVQGVVRDPNLFDDATDDAIRTTCATGDDGGDGGSCASAMTQCFDSVTGAANFLAP